MNTMFFTGSLQEGIAAALQQSKLIVSIVLDDSDESRKWVTLLQNESLQPPIQNNAICLRMQAGSEEANYLAAIYPLPKTPTVVIMKNNGQLVDYITSGTSTDDFVSRTMKALLQHSPNPHADLAHMPSNLAEGNPSEVSVRVERAQASTAPTATPQAAPEQPAQPTDKGKGKAKAEPEAEASSKASDEAKRAYRQKQLEKQQERQRILQQIENDKAARKARAEEEREARRAAAAAAEGEHASEHVSRATTSSGSARKHEFCALQVRLFDGSQVRTRLPSASTVRKDVRAWVDESITEAEGGRSRTAYTFRVVFPSRLIDDTEEDQSLEELGLTPSSTLILVPKQTAATAYDDAPGVGGFFGRIYAAIAHFFAMIALFFSTVFTGAPRTEGNEGESQRLGQQPQTRQQRGQPPAQGGSGSKVKGFQNPDDQRDYQLYNGNSLNFEPRKDEKDDEDSR